MRTTTITVLLAAACAGEAEDGSSGRLQQAVDSSPAFRQGRGGPPPGVHDRRAPPSADRGFTAAPEPVLCVDPDEDESVPDGPMITLPPPDHGDDGPAIVFRNEPSGTGRMVMRVLFDADDRHGRLEQVDGRYAGRTVRVQKELVRERESSGIIHMTTRGAPLRDAQLQVSYELQTERDGTRAFAVAGLEVVALASGAAIDTYNPSPAFANTPSNCVEEGALNVPPFPGDMPPITFPPVVHCSEARCRRLAEAWVHLHHNVWRASQVFSGLESMSALQREHFWDKPGRDVHGNAVSLRSSPAYWFGPYGGDRYASILSGIKKYAHNVQNAKIGPLDLRLRCPKKPDNAGNLCFSKHPVAHHSVVGTMDFCDNAFTRKTCGQSDADVTLHMAVHHEPLHHVRIDWPGLIGWRWLKDSFSHWHGNQCATALGVDTFLCESGNAGNHIRHLATWQAGNGARCSHLEQNARAVDAYAQLARAIGGMVSSGEMVGWPVLPDPTPTPPECFDGSIGCQCLSTDGFFPPDGDYSPDRYCPDDDAPVVCMKTEFGAGNTAGICTSCDDFQGPGCPCSNPSGDPNLACDKGECWGDDTFAHHGGGVGECLEYPPLSWKCLVDCQKLFNDSGAFCMHDHPGPRARCLPHGTPPWEAEDCWQAGGYFDRVKGVCNTVVPECGPGAPGQVTCQEAGYPSYFFCANAFRCEAEL